MSSLENLTEENTMGDIKGLTDDGPKIVGPLLIIAVILVFILLLLGAFMPTISMEV